MGFIEENIMDGENVIYRAKLHWVIFLLPLVFFVPFIFSILSFAFSASFSLSPPPAQARAAMGRVDIDLLTLVVQFAPMLLILTIITGVPSLINYKTSEFAVTNKRVLAKYGFIRRRSTEILLTKIEGVIIDQGILGRSLGYGSVIISGTGSLKNHFKKISNPLEFRKIVQNQISNTQANE